MDKKNTKIIPYDLKIKKKMYFNIRKMLYFKTYQNYFSFESYNNNQWSYYEN